MAAVPKSARSDGTTASRNGLLTRFGIASLFLIAVGTVGWLWLLPAMGSFVVSEGTPRKADAVVVLNTGLEYYPRLIQAARLYREGYARLVVIDGNRKTDVLRRLESMGYRRAAPWDEDSRRILALLGVPREDVLSISAEDAFDTISEVRAVGPVLAQKGIKRLLLVTSRFHTRRADYVWSHLFPDQFEIATIAASEDPYDPKSWWKDGRQTRWVLAEYGGWLFYFWDSLL
jgi:uncharacterized SAM-binding protein YcdF (DUF218 family)